MGRGAAATLKNARQMREEGRTYAEIAEALGVSVTTIHRWLNPERTAAYRNGRACNPERTRELDRRWRQEHRGECPQCGGEMAYDTARRGGKCQACHEDARDRRARLLEKWWAEGLGQTEIARRLGWSINHFHVEMHRLRERGYDLPYRYTKGTRAGRRFPEQVAS